MKKRSIRYLRTAAKSENGMKKVGRSKPRKGPDDLEVIPVEKVTNMRSMTKLSDGKMKNKILEEEHSDSDADESVDNEEKMEKKVGIVGK